ncbi:hypothetical protein [Alkalibacillus aidingensis]|uniref:hypothetical protein n=1 Tax=Alkalibacillus aidingensis TaxID=2747607 RepID=UPI001660A682|nr:hypothetical protein [Alkalibacillus aidingensis]
MWLKLLLIGLLFTNTTIQTASERELIFTPIDSGDIALLHLNEEEMFLINTGNGGSLPSVKEMINQWPEKEIKGILITAFRPENCGNLKALLEDHEIESVYVPHTDFQSCDEPKDTRIFSLNKQETIALSNDFYLQYISENDSKKGSVMISNDSFTVYWYESYMNPEKHAARQAELIYIPSYIKDDHMLGEEVIELDPEIAIINEKKDPQRNKHLHDLFQEAWVDTYFLKRFIAIHISIFENDYDVYLEKLNQHK